MFSRGQILLEIHDAIAMRTQTWVGKKCDAFTRVNCVQNSRCHCYDDTNLGGKNSQCFHEVVLGSYRYTLLRSNLNFNHGCTKFKLSEVGGKKFVPWLKMGK